MRRNTISGYLFIMAGIGMVVAALFLLHGVYEFMTEAVTAEGTVVELVKSRNLSKPVVKFVTQQGQEIVFHSAISSTPPAYSVGEKVEVIYLPDRPASAKINDFFSVWWRSFVMGFIGGMVILTGVIKIYGPKWKAHRDELLRQQGVPIETVLQRVEQIGSISVNGKHPYRILTRWQNPATSKMHSFKSDDIWFDPTNHIKSKRITVFIKRNNPNRYVVDISFLPKVAE